MWRQTQLLQPCGVELPIQFADSEKADIVIMFGAQDSNTHIEEGIRAIVALLDNNETMAKLRAASSREEVLLIGFILAYLSPNHPSGR